MVNIGVNCFDRPLFRTESILLSGFDIKGSVNHTAIEFIKGIDL